MNAHLFISVDNKEEEETEIRILYDTFVVCMYEGGLIVESYDSDPDYVLSCHRGSSTWEEQPCSW
jgi:hypothetical protein